MGKTYTATINVSCLKQHTCVGCASKYSYQLMRNVKGQGSTESAASANAEKAAYKAIEGDSDFHACPVCGIVQPEMVADVRSLYYWAGAIIGVIGVAVALILGLTQVVTIAVSAYVAAAAVAVVLLIFVSGCWYNPNRSPESNRMDSEKKVSLGTLSLDEKAETLVGPVVDEHGGLSAGHMAALAMTLVAVGVAAAPPVMSVIFGWTVNTTCYPAVVGPGDTSCFYFDSNIVSINGMWRGSARARAVNAAELGLTVPVADASTKDSSWGDTISGKSVSNSTNKMWANVHFPDDPQWTGKTVDLELSVQATFPYEAGAGFDNASKNFSHRADVTLSSPGAGTLYHQVWWMGQVGVLVLVVVSTVVLLGTCKSLRQLANPTAVAPVEPEDPVDRLGRHG